MAIIKSLTEQVYNYIVENIRDGQLSWGEKIEEKELSLDLGISRTPIREALIKLSSDGILTNVPRKGFFVKEVSANEVKQSDYTIACLEFYAASLAMDNLDKNDFKKMHQLVNQMDIAIIDRDYISYGNLQIMFHDVYHNRCSNKILIKTIKSLQAIYLQRTYFNKDENKLFDYLAETNKEHSIIIKSLKDKNVKILEEIIFKHWTKGSPDMIL